jgi:predicted homoserine dehydrogenase-like protein
VALRKDTVDDARSGYRMNRPILNALRAREAEGRPILTGVIGAGSFGANVVTTMAHAPGMAAAAVADLNAEAAISAYCAAGHARAEIVCTEQPAAAADAVRAGRPVVVPDGSLLAELPLEAVVDSTGVPDAGAAMASRCLRAGQHVVMVNVEADIVAGAALRRIADAAGVVYTLADGDQPSLICELADFAASLGLKVLAGGKGTTELPKGHPRRAAIEADPPGGKRTWVMDIEGTKTQIEMAAAANVLGWGVDTRGLHGPSIRLDQIATLFGPRECGGLFDRTPVVDFVNCLTPDGNTPIDNPLRHGVFVVVTSPNPHILTALRSKGVPMSADGRRGLLWRPFHLVGVETPYSVAQAVLFKTGTATPLPDPTVELVAVAKHDLPAGTALDGMGDNQTRGVAEMADVAAVQRLLPLGLANGVRLRRAVPSDAALTFDDLEAPGDTPCWRLRRDVGLLPAVAVPA